jgi:hypothetical protein
MCGAKKFVWMKGCRPLSASFNAQQDPVEFSSDFSGLHADHQNNLSKCHSFVMPKQMLIDLLIEKLSNL